MAACIIATFSGYLSLAKTLHEKRELHGEPFNFGPPAYHNHSVQELVQAMSEHWEQVQWNDVSDTGEQHYESGL